MRKMLLVASAMMIADAAWAMAPDRSQLSYDENVTINLVCAPTVKQGNGAFQSCITRQMAELKDHPTPDRSGLTPSRNRVVEKTCHYLRDVSIGRYNGCLTAAMAAPSDAKDKTAEDELAPDYAKVFIETGSEKLGATPVALRTLPKPGSALPPRPDHIAQKALTPEELFKKVEDSVFVVVASPSMADVRTRNIMQGSAVAISDHMLLTNCHVVRDRPLIKLIHDGTHAVATLVAADNATDRCVIKTDEVTLKPVSGVRPLDSINVGERVFAIGTPYQMERTLSDGLVSGIRHEASRNLVQTSAPISPGSSGGGLFDERGNLIGITTLGSSGGAQNLNFAIAASDFWK